MDLKPDELKEMLDFLKFFLGTVVLGGVTLKVNTSLKERAIELEDKKHSSQIALEEQKHLATFLNNAIKKNVGPRRRMAQYFADVTQSDGLKKGWTAYLKRVDSEYNEIQARKQSETKEAESKRVEREDLEAKGKLSNEQQRHMNFLNRQIQTLEASSLALQSELRVSDELTWIEKATSGVKSLPGANLEGANLTGVDLSKANLAYANLRGANLIDADLRRANLHKAGLGAANLSKTALVHATLSMADLRQAILREALLFGADLSEADLSSALLIEATLVGANLTDANLSGADLTGANLNGANLSRADLGRADLSRAVLNKANISAADLRHARNLTPEQVASACAFTDQPALLPDGWDQPPACTQ